MAIPVRRDSERGGALLIVVIACAFLSLAAATYFYTTSHVLHEEMRARDTQASAQDHAAFAAALAASQLGDVEFGTAAREIVVGTGESEIKTVLKDWVARNPYDTGGDGQFERRLVGRVGGDADGYDYTVRVVPIREAHENNVGGDSWLAGVDVPEYRYGQDPARKFTAAYEVTATARNVAADPATSPSGLAVPQLAGVGEVQTIVTLSGESAFNDLDNLATLQTDNPAGVLPNNPTGILPNNPGAPSPNIPGVAPFLTPLPNNQADDVNEVFKVSGEDHYAIRTVAQVGIIDQVVEGLIRIKALSTEFFSIYNNWWTYGKQTVQFMVGDTPNPHIPRTRAVSAAAIDRQMISLDGGREPDIYFSGGKQGRNDADVPRFYNGSNWYSRWYRGRTATIGADGLIVETTDAQINPTTQGLKEQKSLAVGSPEDFMKLYFNYVEPFNDSSWPSNTANDATLNAWKSTWRQVMFANYPKNATKMTTNYGDNAVYAAPRDNWKSARRRRFPLLIMPMNSDGAMLVREYDDANYEKMKGGSSVPPNKWYGTYTWMYRLGITSVAGTNVRGYNGVWGKPSTSNPVSTMTEKAMAPRKLTLPEFVGYRFTTDGNGVPAKLQGSQVVAGVPDFEIDGSGSRVPYYPERDAQGNVIAGNNFNESWQRDTSEGDNWGVNASTLPLMPPTDGIYVRLQPSDEEYTTGFPGGVPAEGYWQAPAARGPGTRRYKRYQTVRDFAFMRNVGTEEEPDMREVSSVFLSFDTNQESDADYFYYLLELSGSIVWPKRTIVAGEDPAERFRHWWEGQSQEGLTGGMPTRPLSAVADADVMALPPEDRLQALLTTFGFLDPDLAYPGINIMLGGDGSMAGFNKVVFETVPENGIGRARKLNAWDDESPFYFYGEDELWGVASALYNQYGMAVFTDAQRDVFASLLEVHDTEGYNDKWEEFLKERALVTVNSLRPPGITYLPYSVRFDSGYSGHKRVQAILAKNIDGIPNPHLDKLLAIQNRITGRSLSLMTFGSHRFNAPAVYVREDGGSLSRMTESDFGRTGPTAVPPVKYPVSLLPGELNPRNGSEFIESRVLDLGASPEVYPWLRMMARDIGEMQLNGRPIRPKFIWLNDPPQTSSSGNRDEGMAGIHTPPEWFMTPDPETGVVLHDVMMRGDNGLTMGGYNREHRGAIGWHREGQGSLPPVFYDEPDFPGEEGFNSIRKQIHSKIFGDHFEYVILSSRDPATGAGFFPFVTMNTTANLQGPTKPFLALFRPKGEDPLTIPSAETFVPRPLQADQMPTFVIEGKELDGAGILVVNGNLHIKTRFAYHGLLVVLGDILVEPTQHESYDSLGNRLDAEGEAITSVNGVWYVINPQTGEIRQDSEGVPIKSAGGPANEWLGHLIVQGKAVAGGSVGVTPAVHDPDGNLERPAGKIDIRSSRKAVEDAMGTWIRVGPNEKIVSTRYGWSTGNTVSTMAID